MSTSYTIPAMNLENEFSDLDFVGKYVDQLLLSTGDESYATVYEWGPHGPGPYPPAAIRYRVDGAWDRRGVSVSIVRKPDGSCAYTWVAKEKE